ncbi:hypothetical protein ES708_10853 [subsurface metagenome]
MIHHTWTDWDWSDENWYLGNAPSYAKPGALQFYGTPLTLNLCNLADALCLPQGKLVTDNHAYNGLNSIIHFRNQKAAPDVDFANCYYVRLQENHITLCRRVNSVDTVLGDWTPLNQRNVWRHWTVTWWLYHAPYQEPAVRIRINGDAAGAAGPWQEQLDDPANQWAASETNRCGLAGVAPTYPQNFDNTEIWLPTP